MREIWRRWKKLAEKIGDFQATIIFSILYFILITPLGLISSIFKDFLQIRKFPEWNVMTRSSGSLKKLKDQ